MKMKANGIQLEIKKVFRCDYESLFRLTNVGGNVCGSCYNSTKMKRARHHENSIPKQLFVIDHRIAKWCTFVMLFSR